MTDALLQQIATQVLWISLKLAGPTLAVSLGVGLLVSIFQAVTQIQEMTLTFIPKLIAVAIVGMMLGPWMLHSLEAFTIEIFHQIPAMSE